MTTADNDASPHLAKGKGRAILPEVDEHTPLLASGSNVHQDVEPIPLPSRRRRVYSTLLSVFLFSLLFCIVIFVFLAILAYSLGSSASGISTEELIQRALVVRGPDRVDVLRITTEGGVWLKVKGRVGVDAGAVTGLNTEDGDSTLRDLWKSLGRWGVHQLNRISVNLTTIDVSSDAIHLANISVQPLDLPLTVNPPPDDTWLSEVSLPVYVVPTRNVSSLASFLRQSWRDGVMRVEANVRTAVVRGGPLYGSGWKSWITVTRTRVHSNVQMKGCYSIRVVPALPGLPPPGHNNRLPSPSRLVTLQSFQIESRERQLQIYANATAINPLPSNFHYTAPHLPFTVSIPRDNDTLSLIPVASVETQSFRLTHPNVSLFVAGSVLPLGGDASSSVSTFISNYVSLRDSEVVISSPLFPNITIDAIFPALRPKPQILRNVTIKGMRVAVSGSGTSMFASGTVFARVVLPKGIQAGIDVTHVLPDVLVFDGPVPDAGTAVRVTHEQNVEVPPARPLPDPLPERAFAHIRPSDWLNASSIRVPSQEGDGTTVELEAKIVDVPLEVLPGRDKEFRNFVGKVIFGTHGAFAGVQGVAAVTVRIEGLPLRDDSGEMELDDLPFQGNVHIGKESTF